MKKILFLGALLGLLAQSSYGTITFNSTGTSAGGAAVNASAAITISGSLVTVTLTDLQANPGGVANLLNGIQLVVSGATGATGLGASDATAATVASGGSYTTASVSGATIASSWALTSASSTITLTALGGGQPKYLIIGPDSTPDFNSGNGGYTAAGGSIAGNGPHNPFIENFETFTFSLTGSPSFNETNITGVTFLYGTSSDYGSTTRTNITSVPEPTTIIAGALLLVPMGVQAVRSYRNRKQQQ
jgi:hypothetical protein